jgi:hypothetical protein
MVARLSREQNRIRPVRERLSQINALIFPGVVLLSGVATVEGMRLQWGRTTVGMNYNGDVGRGGDAIQCRWR